MYGFRQTASPQRRHCLNVGELTRRSNGPAFTMTAFASYGTTILQPREDVGPTVAHTKHWDIGQPPFCGVLQNGVSAPRRALG